MSQQVTESERLQSDIQTLRAAIARDWDAIDEHALTEKEQAELRLHITLCVDDLVALLKLLNGIEHARRT
jgi:hypothetical protein